MIITDKRYEPEVLHKLWDVELEILDVIDVFCKKNQIKYSIAYGTLLGAVRHKGFIPWDDDLDIMMMREDYEKFRELWLKNPPKGYTLVDDDLYEEYCENFMKIRKEGTTFIQFETEFLKKDLPLGIFVDIFPLDRVAPKRFSRKTQYYYSLINMLYTRKHPSGKKGIVGVGEKVLLSLPRFFQEYLKNKARKNIMKWNNSLLSPLVSFCTFEYASIKYPADIFSNIICVEFNRKRYCSTSDYDSVLKSTYGDYLSLPPKEKRASHFPLLLDFEHSWEELKESL